MISMIRMIRMIRMISMVLTKHRARSSIRFLSKGNWEDSVRGELRRSCDTPHMASAAIIDRFLVHCICSQWSLVGPCFCSLFSDCSCFLAFVFCSLCSLFLFLVFCSVCSCFLFPCFCFLFSVLCSSDVVLVSCVLLCVLVSCFLLVLAVVLCSGQGIPQFYVYKLPIDHLSGCYVILSLFKLFQKSQDVSGYPKPFQDVSKHSKTF